MDKSYKEVIDQKNNMKVLEITKIFPTYVKDFFNHLHNSASRTKLSYAYNIKNFYTWLIDNNPDLKGKEIKDVSLNVLSNLDITDIDEYFAYMSTINTPAGIAQKSSALNSFFKYLKVTDKLEKNPMDNLRRVKVEDKPIIKLNEEQIYKLINTIKLGWKGMSSHQESYWKRDKVRDLCMITIMLSTGIRVSECSCLDVDDVDLKEYKLLIVRKGHKEKQPVYFNDDAAKPLADYLSFRKTLLEDNNKERALFLSDRKTRISVQTIENIVKKYTVSAGFGKMYTPHKLRKTYGTTLYKKTGDIYLVAGALGHTDVDTTTKHYVEKDEEKLRDSRNVIGFKNI